jgi:ferritin-like metal-binding protein YciE
VIHSLAKDCNAAIEKTDQGIVDAIILAAATEVEHFEVAVYETLLTNAEVRGALEVAALLRENLQQEQAALERVKSAQRADYERFAALAV